MHNYKITHIETNFLNNPTDNSSLDYLVSMYSSAQNWKKCSELIQLFLMFSPNNPNQWFNYGFYLKRCNKYKKSIDAYNKSLILKINTPEEIHVNIALIYSEHLNRLSQARTHLNLALEKNEKYIPALYNLGNLLEDLGDTENALGYFYKIIKIDKNNINALIRILTIDSSIKPNSFIVKKLEDVFFNSSDNDLKHTEIGYSLGKFYDKQKEYNVSSQFYIKANQSNNNFIPQYKKWQHELYIENIIACYSEEYFNELPIIDENEVYFICGMFRSGSTLVEQILDSHPMLSSGGELEYFLRFTYNNQVRYPEGTIKLSQEKLTSYAKEYLNYLRCRFDSIEGVLDKRPDNYLYIGLIKSLFPNAKFIHTNRDERDNALSIYFLQLGPLMNYATDLDNISHYQQQHKKLMSHWQKIFPKDIISINYEDIVKTPKDSITNILKFLGLEWDDSCLNFHASNKIVKTPSAAQVRQPLYQDSIGRYGIYKKYLYS